MPALSSSRIPAVLAKLGPMDAKAITDLRPFLGTVLDPRSLRGQWRIENSSHHIRDVTFAEDACTVHTGSVPRAMATLRNLANGALQTLGAVNIAKTTRAIRALPERALPFFGISDEPGPSGT